MTDKEHEGRFEGQHEELLEAHVWADVDEEPPLIEWWVGVDKEGWDHEEELEVVLEAKWYPPGTRLIVELPRCPNCGEARLPGPQMKDTCEGYIDGNSLNGVCGFDWQAWVESTGGGRYAPASS